MESCVDVVNDFEWGLDGRRYDCYSKREERLLRLSPNRKNKNYTEFPPPIPLLARTENLPAHMPWILKRHYTSDGRLILTEEKVRHHEYFKAHRSNGRLRLHLVPLDGVGDVMVPPIISYQDDGELDDEECSEFDDDEDCSEFDDDEFYDDNVDAYDDDDDYDNDYDAKDDHNDVGETIDIVNSPNGPAGKCFNIDSGRIGSPRCVFGVPVPAISHFYRWVMANANGSSKGFLGQTAYGGLFHDSGGHAINAFREPIDISVRHAAKLAAFIFAIITAWKKGWLRYGWKQILSLSYLFSLNPILLLGLCVLSGDIV